LATCRLDLQTAAHTESTFATLMRTLRSLLAAFPKTASEDLAQLTKVGKASGEFVPQCKELIEQSEKILALYKEEENEEENKEEGEEEGEREGESEEKVNGEDKEEYKQDEEENNSAEMEDDEEVSEDMQNILEYRLGQMLILMHSVKFAQATLVKKRKHSEI
jgi:cobalamin biosynthesis protein CobT